MASGSIAKSDLKFLNYKVTNFKFDCDRTLNILSSNNFAKNLWNYEINIIKPVFSKSQKMYFCGLVMKAFIFDNNKKKVVSCECELVGLFQGSDKLSSELESNLVKVQAPAILMAYMRSAITSYVANAGFGSIVIPLLNINRLASDAFDDMEIEEVE